MRMSVATAASRCIGRLVAGNGVLSGPSTRHGLLSVKHLSTITATHDQPLPSRYTNRTHEASHQRQDTKQRNTGKNAKVVYATSLLLLGLGTSFILRPTESEKEPSPSLARQPTVSLLRSYLVWTLTSFPTLVDNSPKLFEWGFKSSIPFVPRITEWIIRKTFFIQFIPGETALECLDEMTNMRERGVGHALNYSAEGDCLPGKEQDAVTARYLEICRALDVQGDFETKMAGHGWERGSSSFALKMTGLIDPKILTRASTTMHRLQNAHIPQTQSERISTKVPYPGSPLDISSSILTPETSSVESVTALTGSVGGMKVLETDSGLVKGDLEALKVLWDRLDILVQKARKNGIRFIIDAEESWLQPALDGYTQLLSIKYNRPPVEGSGIPWTGPVVYGTYQSYLTRQPEFISACLQHAKENGYALGLKVVRGGYIVKENGYVKSPERKGPSAVWPSKIETDNSYNQAISTILSTLSDQLRGNSKDQALSVIFGTHNRESVDTIISTLQSTGLAERGDNGKLKLREDVQGRVNIAQLYGMREDLSDVILETFETSKSAISMKFVAYGNLVETMPFLGRRAIENKSIMSGPGGAAAERRRVGVELRRRFFGFWG